MLSYRRYEAGDLFGVLDLDILDIEKREAWASLGKEPKEALLASIECSDYVWVITYKEEICGVFGLSIFEINGRVIGVPWLVSNDIPLSCGNQRKFIRVAKDVVGYMTMKCDVLCNVISTENTQSIKWLRSLGFNFSQIPFTYARDPSLQFVQFYKEVRA